MNDLRIVFDRVVEIWSLWMTSMAWQVAALVAMLAVAGFMLRRCSARFRFCLWTLVPVRLLLPPSLALITGWAWWILPEDLTFVTGNDDGPVATADMERSDFTEPLFRARASSLATDKSSTHAGLREVPVAVAGAIRKRSADDLTQVHDQVTSDGGGQLLLSPRGTVESRSSGLKSVVFVTWLIGVGWFTFCLRVGYAKVNRWIAESAPADASLEVMLQDCCKQLGLRSHVTIRMSSVVWTPIVTGLVRPVILMPPAVPGSLDPKELRAVLMHELQHIVRWDFGHECALTLVQIVYFFHPCVWLAARYLRRLREQACDEATIAVLGGERANYGSGFVKVAELLVRPAPRLTLGIVDSDEHTSSRLRRILDPKLPVGRGLSWSSLAVVVLMGLVLIPSAARQAAVAVPGVQSVAARNEATAENLADDAKPGNDVTSVPADDNLPDPPTDDVMIVGDDDVEPIEIHGQVLDPAGLPSPNSTVELRGRSRKSRTSWTSSITADSMGTFRIRLQVNQDMLPALSVSAVSADNSLLGVYRFPWDQNSPPQAIEIRLAKARTIRLKVNDKFGAALPDARAVVALPYPGAVQPVTTNKNGIAEFVVPASELIDSVVAWKDNAGLDYRAYTQGRERNADQNAKRKEFPVNGIETLTLEGAASVTVRVVDEEGQPLNSVDVYPWHLGKESENPGLNLSMYDQTFFQTTNIEGEAIFTWLPLWHTGKIDFFSMAKGYDHRRGSYSAEIHKGLLEIVVKKLVPIRGRVRNADGTPAGGIRISAIGAGYGMDAHSKDTTSTDASGSYEVLVPPDQIYLVVASGKGVAAAPQTGFAVFKGQPEDDVNFMLRPATRVYGTLVDEDTGAPIPNETVHVYQHGQDLDATAVRLPNPDNLRDGVRPSTIYRTQTDANGQFNLFVGDGNFEIRPPREEKAEKFEIAGETERKFVVRSRVIKEAKLSGVVRIAGTEALAVGARVSGASRRHGRDWHATTNEAGEFRVSQYPAATYIHAVSSDKMLGAITEIDAKQPSVELALHPVGTAKGRLLRHDTKEPWAGQIVQYGIRVPDEKNHAWSSRFGGRVTTAVDGTFELVGLVSGWDYEMNMNSRSDGAIPSLGKVRGVSGQSVTIGDVTPWPP
jgi:beta-lactamase regulating signal transducer with metallopeptidase domain/protocatechuate 3,4-dioxygenase beta subunit